jgi:hypothetical protein
MRTLKAFRDPRCRALLATHWSRFSSFEETPAEEFEEEGVNAPEMT